ncbi:cytochrome P450 [Penicillium brevicompactum]|uniref:cytochrome P450 monooxygenase n=1 Tax=Penicillium brevicompactum TaxID=5074 RepID=UPI00253FBC70|nr:cytochrome P450 monooxygenase [Penicillium brevicompactum]KAJ5347312.1 cytochrome P450 monooxygenase [Penicillium brevicompactum]
MLLPNDSLVVLLCLIFPAAFFLWKLTDCSPRFPLANKTPGEFMLCAPTLIKQGLAKWKVFQFLTNDGIQVFLSHEYTKEIRNHNSLSFGEFMHQRFHANLYPFRPYLAFAEKDEAFVKFIRKKLVAPLADLVNPLSETATSALRGEWTDNPTWHKLGLKSSLSTVIAQLLAKAFVGEPLCHNARWLQITVEYTVDSIQASEALRRWPAALRPIMIHILPVCRKLKAELDEATSLIDAVLQQRHVEKETALQNGKVPQRYMDAFEWVAEHYSEMNVPCDPVMVQLALAVTGIHTTTDMLTQFLYDIVEKEGLADSLRDEIVRVVKQDGLTLSALNKMRLMDSCLKESQRLKPVQGVALQRIAIKDFDLSDGTRISKNTPIILSAERMWDAEVYTSPNFFDPYRFVKMRDESPANETTALAVSPSAEHIGWGLGKHACPGRFLAIHELKIVLCHILLRYDFRHADTKPVQTIVMGTATLADPFAMFEVRRKDHSGSEALL